jgi:hypothetical protein
MGSALEPVVAGGALPGRDLLLGLVLGHAITFLDLAGQLGATTLDDVEVVVGELAPLRLDLALELLPVAFDAIPVHVMSFRSCE